MPSFESLPPLLQVVATMLVIVVGGGIAVFCWTKKALASFNAPDPAKSSDAVVVSASFADGAAIRELRQCIAHLKEAVDNLRNDTRDGTEEQARTTAAVARLGDRVGRVVEVLDDRLPHSRDPH